MLWKACQFHSWNIQHKERLEATLGDSESQNTGEKPFVCDFSIGCVTEMRTDHEDSWKECEDVTCNMVFSDRDETPNMKKVDRTPTLH